MNLLNNAVKKGLQNPIGAVKYIYNKLFKKYKLIQFIDDKLLSKRWDNIYKNEWDLVIILDGCRYDLAKNATEECSLEIGDPEPYYSVGSCSSEWVRRTFRNTDNDLLSKTAYISGNHHTEYSCLKELKYIEKVWEYGWDNTLGTIPPRIVTDRAMDIIRNETAEKYVVHYMQPHLPPIGEATYDGQGFTPEKGWLQGNPWKRIKRGELDSKPVIKAYKKNIFPVLEEVDLLLDNVDADNVVITSDHGNYLGENNRWGHPPGQLHDAVRIVPWWETTATDQGTHQPADYNLEKSNVDRQEQLKAMGYL